MPTKCCWVIHGSLTSERKASTSPSSFINHSILLLNRALKRQAPCFYMHFEVRALDRLRTRRRVNALGLRAVEVIICMITRDFSVISMTSQASLSLSLSLSQKSLTHNIGSASALPIIYKTQQHSCNPSNNKRNARYFSSSSSSSFPPTFWVLLFVSQLETPSTRV